MSFQKNVDYIASLIREALSTKFIIGAGTSRSAGTSTANKPVEMVGEQAFPSVFGAA